jgi:hypothetical protein
MGERLKTHFIADFTDTKVEVRQQAFRLLDSQLRDVFSEIQSGLPFEQFAKIVRAGVRSARHIGEREVAGQVIFDEFPPARHSRRFFMPRLNQNLITRKRKVLCEDSEQTNNRVVLFAG